MTKCKSCGADNASGDSFCSECGKPLNEKAPGGISGLETIAQVATRPPKNKAVNEALVLEPGSVFADRYTIVQMIGQGGMGVVYKATENLAGREREIALKLIRADRLVNQQAIDKLISEGALTQDIRHPNVVTVYNVGEADGQPFVAMEYVNGVSLREWHQRQYAARQEIPLVSVAVIVNSILQGLEAAHAMNIVHRDLKPENIMLTGEPGPEGASLKILDFGIARAPGSVINTTGSAGTPEYMAPEQITNPDGVTAAADLYSVSIIFYEMLMDALPRGPWQAPSAGRPDVPAALDAVIQKGLSTRAASRQQTVAEYRADLARVLGGRRPEPEPDSPGGSWFSDKKKLTKYALIGGGALVVLVGLDQMLNAPSQGPSYVEGPQIDNTGPDDGSSGSPPANEGYANLSGRWNTGSSSYFDMRVDSAGNFAGTGMSTDGVPIEIKGSIPNRSYQLGNAMVVLNGTVEWRGDCHLAFTTYNPDNTVNYADTFHVDHAAGGPCPARFGG